MILNGYSINYKMEFKYYIDFEKLKRDYSKFLWYNFKRDKFLKFVLFCLTFFIILHISNNLFINFYPVLVESLLYGLIVTIFILVFFSIIHLYFKMKKNAQKLQGLNSFACTFKFSNKRIETDYDKNYIEWKDITHYLVIGKTIYLVLKNINNEDVLILNNDGLIDMKFDSLVNFIKDKLNKE